MRPFRAQPPDVDGALLRRRVQRRLVDRFDVRVTVIQAGAGFGKTTSLAQAVSQNLLGRRGVDHWVTCEPGDADGSHLLDGIGLSLGLETPTSTADVSGAVARLSPAAVCLVFDDVHEIPDGSNGAALLSELIEALPGNAHFVLASRRRSPVPLARLDAQGRVARIDGSELALDVSEVERIAALNDADGGPLGRLGGWPALVALAARSDDATDFLDEEVVSWLSDAQRTALEATVVLGGVDEDLLRHCVDLGVDALAEVPLLHQRNGWYAPHDLWIDVIEPRVDSERVDRLRASAVRFLIDSDHIDRAADLSLRTNDPATIENALRLVVIEPLAHDITAVRRWLALLPESVVEHPIGRFLAGLSAQHADPMTDSVREQFEAAATGFRSLGDDEAEVASLVQLGFWHHLHRNVAGLFEVGVRMAELAGQGVRLARPYVAIGEAFALLSRGEPEAVLDVVRTIEPGEITIGFRATVDWLHAQALSMAGHPSIEPADSCVAWQVPIPGFSVIGFSSRMRAGRIEELLAQSWFSDQASPRDAFLQHVWSGVLDASVGRAESARRHLDAATSLAGGGADQVEIALGLLDAAIIDLVDGPAAARHAMQTLLERHPPSSTNRVSYGGTGASIARFFPEHVPPFARPRLGPFGRRDLDLGGALRDLDAGDLGAVEDLTWPELPGEILASVFLRAACELTTAAWAVGRPEAETTAAWLARTVGEPARRLFRELTDHPLHQVAEAADQIVATIPVPPPARLDLRLLGPATISVNGAPLVDATWRRERVRSLLGFLALHQTTTREAAMAALWPEADETSARRNLRSTLNLLLQVLEPHRTAHDAPFFVRSTGSRLQLVAGDHLTIDTWRFDSLLDEADRLEADGVPELAIEPLVEALELYGGDFLADAADDDWSGLERDRLRSRFVRAAVRTAEFLAAFGRTDEALAAGSRALHVEPWSESAHRAMVAAHLSRGDRASAQRAMRRCQDQLEEMGGPADEVTLMLARRLGIGGQPTM